ncbi:MAG: tetratricopeptide repeat protein [Methanomassiliicoccales archaeon]|nr:tetratricopeptide repeat protein [Methanomassiliicoccales archaeon]
MSDLEKMLEQNERQRLLAAIKDLGDPEWRDLMISLIGGMGVRVQSAKEEKGTLVIYGQGEGGYIILVSRTAFSDPELVVRSLVEEAKTSARVPVFMTLQDLDPGTLNYLDKEVVSYADLGKFLALIHRYGLDDPLMAKEDLKVLEDRGAPCLPSMGKLEALIDEAEERHRKGDLGRAVQLLTVALEIKPLNDTIWLKKASYLLEMGRAPEALVAANHAAEIRPGDAATWFLIAHIQGQLEDRDKELSAYDTVLRINPAHAPALLNKGATLYEMGRLEWALKVFNDMVKRYPQEPRGWNNRGLVLKGMEHPIEAQASFEKASVLDREYADPLINLARMKDEVGNWEGAVEAWKDVLRLVDSRADIWAHLGACLRELGQNEDALTAMDRALDLDPTMEQVREERDRLAALMEGERAVEAPVADGRTLDQVINGEPAPEPPKEEPAIEEEPVDEPVKTVMEEPVPEPPNQEPIVEEEPVKEPIEAVVEVPALEPVKEELSVEEEPVRETTETVDEVPVPELVKEELPVEEEPVPATIAAEKADEEAPLPEDIGPVSIAPVEPALPAIVQEERSLQEREPAGQLEVIPEPSKPVEFKAEQLSMEVPPELPKPVEFKAEPTTIEVPQAAGALQLVDQGPAAEVSPVAPVLLRETVEETVVQPPEVAVEKEAPRTRAVWLYEISLPPLPSEREDRVIQEASLLLAGGEREKALQVIGIAQKESSDLELLRLKARILLSLGRGEEAAEALKEALRLAPKDIRTVLDTEALFHRFGGEGSQLLRAIDECQEARARTALDLLERQDYAQLARTEVKDEAFPAKLAKVLAQIRQGRYRDASKVLKALMSEFPASSECLNNLGVCMRFMGEFDYDQAIHMMELAMEVDPHYSDAMNNIGCTLFAAGRYEQALKVLKATADEDRRPEYLLNLSNVQMALGDPTGAKESLTTALKLEESADVLYMLGVIAEGENEFRWALSLYQDALAQSPGFREAQAGRDRTKLLSKK